MIRSFNVYDSLAETYRKNKHNELAIETIKKSLQLDPKNENALKMLEQLAVHQAGKLNMELPAMAGCYCERRVTTMISPGGHRRILGPQVPAPRLTSTVMPSTW